MRIAVFGTGGVGGYFVDSLAPDVISSLQRDIMAGKPSELEAQTGAVVRFGRELGVPIPVNEFISTACCLRN